MQTDILCGANAVAAAFRRRPDSILRLYYTQERKIHAGPLCGIMAKLRRPYRLLPPEEMAKACGTTHHGGIAAVARPRDLAWLDAGAPPPRVPLLLMLDGVSNPHNLGAIARSAAFFGVRAMVIHLVPDAAVPSDAAYRTAEGGLEDLDLYRTRDLPGVLSHLRPYYRTVGTAPQDEAPPLAELPRDRPIALVLGNEERGLSPAVQAACRRMARIAGGSQVQSLNVAQSAAILLYEFSKAE